MTKEALLETQAAPSIGANLTGTLNALAVGTNAIVGAGTNFDPEITVGDIISFLDTAGTRRYYTIATRTDDTNLVTSQAITTVSGAGINFQVASMNSPYIIGGDVNAVNPNQLPIYGNANFNLMAANPLNAALATVEQWIDENEGVKLNSMYMRLPYQYTMSSSQIMYQLVYRDRTGASFVAVPEVGITGGFNITIENQEMPMDNIYIPPYSVAIANENRYGFRTTVPGSRTNQTDIGPAIIGSEPTISAVNAPSALDGELMPIVFGLKFRHGIAITI